MRSLQIIHCRGWRSPTTRFGVKRCIVKSGRPEGRPLQIYTKQCVAVCLLETTNLVQKTGDHIGAHLHCKSQKIVVKKQQKMLDIWTKKV